MGSMGSMGKENEIEEIENEYEAMLKKVAVECVNEMSESDREYIRMNPFPYKYHFSYGLYIRNTYGPRFEKSGLACYICRDNMSSSVLEEIIKILLPGHKFKY